MGRTVIVEESVRSDFERLTLTRQTHVGVLIGQFATSKDYVSLFVRTPLTEEIQKEDDSGGVLEEDEIVPEWWLLEHARQVSSLLCGGLSVVGVAVWCSTDQFKTYQLKLRQFLITMATTENHHRYGNYILLHHPTNSKKTICQSLDPFDAKAGVRTGELKYASHFCQWIRLQSGLQLDSNINPGSLVSAENTLSDLLKPFFTLLSEARLTVRGRLVTDAEGEVPLVKTKKNSPSQTSTQAIQMEWLLQPYSSGTVIPELLPQARTVALDGCLSLVAFVPPKSTLKDAVNAMKEDARRSLSARLSALAEANTDGCKLSHEREKLPCRVSIALPRSPVELYEYMLPGESLEDCVGRVSELTGCQATDLKSEVMEEFQAIPLPTNSSSPPKVAHHHAAAVAMDTVEGVVVKRYTGLISILATVGVALLALAVWLVLNKDMLF